MDTKKREEDINNCSICLEPITSPSMKGSSSKFLLKTPCDHVYHRNCLEHWLKCGYPGNFCPLCKRVVHIRDTIPVTFKQSKVSLRRSARIHDKNSTKNGPSTPEVEDDDIIFIDSPYSEIIINSSFLERSFIRLSMGEVAPDPGHGGVGNA